MIPKEFIDRWKKGIASIPPEELMRIKIYYGILPSIFGTIFATIMLALSATLWYITFAIGFTVIIQVMQFIEEWQKYKMLKSIKDGTLDFIEGLQLDTRPVESLETQGGDNGKFSKIIEKNLKKDDIDLIKKLHKKEMDYIG